MIGSGYVNEDIKKKIYDVARIEDIANDFGTTKPSGSSLTMTCPLCNAKSKLSITPSKQMFRCFRCETGGKDAVSYLTKMQGFTFPDALHYIADRYGIDLEEKSKVKKRSKKASKDDFLKQKLKSSGIRLSTIKFMQKIGNNSSIESKRYEKGSLDDHFNVVPGNDIILRYVDFDYNYISYTNPYKKTKNYYRVRFNNPALHKDRSGKSTKYKSPYKSGNHLWVPNPVIAKVRKHEPIETLIIDEGELKADKLSQEGIDAVGISGIHNFSTSGNMSLYFQRIIQDCQVKNVVFMLDADWEDLSIHSKLSVDSRPMTFFRAVAKFRDYFYAYSNNGIYLNIYFGYHKDKKHKGIDDLMVAKFKGKEEELKADINKALVDREGIGEHVQVYKISSMTDYKLKEFWHIHSRPAFLEHYKEELLQLKEFKYGKIKYRINDDNEIEIFQKMLSHEKYWIKDEWETRSGKIAFKYKFSYQGARIFLKNRGYGVLVVSHDHRRFIHIENNVITEVSPQDIQDYMLEFTEELQEEHVLELLLSGGFRYFGDKTLSAMYKKLPQLIEPKKEAQYLFFKNSYWKITADSIESKPLAELPGHIWQNQMINFEPKQLPKPIFDIKHNEETSEWKIKQSTPYHQSDIARFIELTSGNWWRKHQEVARMPDGKEYIRSKSEEDKEELTKSDIEDTKKHIISKMLASGYVLSNYRDLSNMKALICMDGIESSVGQSEGGTGKSVFSTMFEHLIPTHVIDAKKKKLTDDPHIYEEVDERTKAIVFDDCRVNLDFEFFLSQITRALTVNPKGTKRFRIDPPVFIFATNHAIRGDGNSFRRRQYLLSFYDYFNSHRNPKDEFGHLMFSEWDYEQWNLFYNYMASCIQAYLKYGLKTVVNDDDLIKRKQRQAIGEELLQWLLISFDIDGVLRNKEIEKYQLYNKYSDENRKEARYVSPLQFKKKLKIFCKYQGLDWNPQKEGIDHKKNSKEYFTIGDEQFDINNTVFSHFV